MNDTKEELLDAWLRMATGIRGPRLVKDFSFNEVIVCRMIALAEENGGRMTPGIIGRETGMLKSLVNRTLVGLEKKGILTRVRSEEDARTVELTLTDAGRALYQREHEAVLGLVTGITDSLGEEDSTRLAALMYKAVTALAQHEKGRD